MKYIASIKTDFKEKFGIPRQSGLVKEAKGKIIFEKRYRDINAIRGLEEFSHIWVIWEFSKAKRDKWSPTVRPPLLGGNTRMGVFATRSPFRPNPIGMSLVKLDEIEITENYGAILHVSGVDILDDTPVIDIKPYLPYTDSIPDAKAGFTEGLKKRELKVEAEKELLSKIDKEKKEEIINILRNDPRPSYQEDGERIYSMCYGEYEIKFSVISDILIIKDIRKEGV